MADFAYSGRMYRDALRVLERELGQPQTALRSLKKLNCVPPVNLHKKESIINFACVISSCFVWIVVILGQSERNRHLKSSLCRLPPNMKKFWSSYMINHYWYCPNLIDFNVWLKVQAETHERMTTFHGKSKTEESIKTKTTICFFAPNSKPN